MKGWSQWLLLLLILLVYSAFCVLISICFIRSVDSTSFHGWWEANDGGDGYSFIRLPLIPYENIQSTIFLCSNQLDCVYESITISSIGIPMIQMKVYNKKMEIFEITSFWNRNTIFIPISFSFCATTQHFFLSIFLVI